MKTAKLLLSFIVGLGAMSAANATTIHLGNVDGQTRNFGDFISRHSTFKDFVRFNISQQSGVDFSFQSFYDIIASSFNYKLQEHEKGGWTNVTFSSPSFVDLTAGTYRWVVTGST